jgi:hypothetical protein
MSEAFVAENRVRGGKVVLVTVPESKYQAKRDVYRNCTTIGQAGWVRDAIEKRGIKPQQAAELVLTSVDAAFVTQPVHVVKERVRRAAKPVVKKTKKPSIKAEVLAYLDQSLPCLEKAELVSLTAMEFDITKANARYYIDRVWKGKCV